MIGPEKKYRIRVEINGSTLTYNECVLIQEDDSSFVCFVDKFGIEFRYNKNVVVSMEVLK